MDLLAAGYNALRGPVGQTQSGAETVDKLCDRVANATLLDDRRAAVLGLKGLSRDWKLDVGTKGMPVLLKVLERDNHDTEITVAVLETLKTLCSAETSRSGDKMQADLGVQFTEIFVKDAQNVNLLLQILEETDFYVRFNSVQLLGTLLQNKGEQLQECILTAPMGMTRLMDLLDDGREAVRNEGLLLLISLTQTNADIQKIVAFENAFERLLAIIMDEGGADGDIVVQDCLQLIQNLLRYNISNQNYFRETSCIQRISAILPAFREEDGSRAWSNQKVFNTIHVLQLIRILVVPGSLNTVTNQNVIRQCGMLPPIIQLALAVPCPQIVKCEALYALADIIRSNHPNQELFGGAVVTPATPPPPSSSPHGSTNELKSSRPNSAVHALLQPAFVATTAIAVNEYRHELATRAAAAYLFQCYVLQNPEAQLALTTTLNPPPKDNPNTQHSADPPSVGSLLLASLLELESSRKDPYRSWFGAVMLSHLLRGNEECKTFALNVKFGDESSGEEPVAFLTCLVHSLLAASRAGTDTRVMIAILFLLCMWLHEHEPSVTEFLSEGSNLQFLIELINKSSNVDPLVQGLAAFLLGIAFEFNTDPNSPMPRAQLQPIMLTRIGADQFSNRIARLRDSRVFQNTPIICQVGQERDANDLPDLWFDYAFVEFFKTHCDTIQKSITVTTAKSGKKQVTGGEHHGDADEIIKQYKHVITSQDKDITALKSKLQEMEARLAGEQTLLSQIEQRDAQIAALNASLQESNAKFKKLEEEQEDLLVCLAEQDEKAKKVRVRLRELGEDIPEDEEGEEEEEEKEEEDNGREKAEIGRHVEEDGNDEEESLNRGMKRMDVDSETEGVVAGVGGDSQSNENSEEETTLV